MVWDLGTTEGGSSGSPLFNANHRVIGQLYGGAASCSNTNGHDNYGRFNVSWTGNGESDNRRKLQPWLDPIGAGVVTLEGQWKDSLSNLSISGPSTICNQEAYEVENLPSGATIQWSAMGNAQLVAGQGTGVATFSKTGNGAATIKATINGAVVLEKEVWAGAAMMRTQDESYYQDGGVPFNYYDLCVSQSISESNRRTFVEKSGTATHFEWRKIQGNYSFSTEGSTVWFYDLSGYSLEIEVRAQNACGWSEWANFSFSIENCDGGYSPYYFISPNSDGLNDTWEIGAKEKSKRETTAFRSAEASLPVYNVTIFNTKGAIVYKKKNYMQDQERFYGVGNVGNYTDKILPDGVYLYSILGSITDLGHLYIKRE